MKQVWAGVMLGILGALLVTAPLVAGPLVAAPVAAQEKVFLTIASGPTGGDWYTMGGTIGDLAKSVLPGAVVTVTSGGAVANLSVVDAGKADVGISMASLYNEARTGTGEFQGKAKERVRAMAYLANIFMSFFLVAEESQIRSIEEIKDKRIPIRLLTSTRASSPAVAAERMLAEYGISFVGEETPHMAESVILIARKDLPDEVVYRLTRAISGNPDQIRRVSKTYQTYTPASAWRNVGGPLHPGAERYYREAGYMK